jgi:hypothetical protein
MPAMTHNVADLLINLPGSKGMGRLGPCASCARELPLCMPDANESGTAWICVGCGAVYHAVFDQSAPAHLVRNVRPATIFFDRTRLVQPPQAIAALLEQMKAEGQGLGDRRQAARRWMVTHVAAVAVNANYDPVGEPFMAVTRNISTRGLALIHTRTVESGMLVVELLAHAVPAIQLIMRVARCRALGRFYEIAGPFVVRLPA